MSILPFSQAAKLDPRITVPRPSFDPLLTPALDSCGVPEEPQLDVLRGLSIGIASSAKSVIQERPDLNYTEHSIPGPDGNVVILSVFTPKEPSSGSLPALYHIHGGGQLAGDQFSGVEIALKIIGDVEFVLISVDYRLAPETRAPGAALDCYTGLLWASKNASSLGIDPAQIIVYGISGGGPLAAATCLLARDRKEPTIPIQGQMLLTPMLDDRCESVSEKQFEYGTLWCGAMNRRAWGYVLGENRGTERVTPYQSPARATDLSNLPPTFIDAAECEVFRDPAVLYAMNMWRCASTCELHVWPGAYHGFEVMSDEKLLIVQAAIAAKSNWVKRIWVENALRVPKAVIL